MAQPGKISPRLTTRPEVAKVPSSLAANRQSVIRLCPVSNVGTVTVENCYLAGAIAGIYVTTGARNDA
jgi:hypothetical protein